MSTYSLESLFATFGVRELTTLDEVEQHLALRYDVYRETYRIDSKRADIDLEPSDWNSHLIGVFHGDELVGTVRVVKRHRVARTAALLDGLCAKKGLLVQPVSHHLLPSEATFAYQPGLDGKYRNRIVELGRLSVRKDFRKLGAYYLLVLAAMGTAYLDGINYCLYSCATEMQPLYARWMPIVHQLVQRVGTEGFPGFRFTKPSVALIASIADAPSRILEQAILAGVQCHRTLHLSDPYPAPVELYEMAS